MRKAVKNNVEVIEYKGYKGTVEHNKDLGEFNGKVLNSPYVLIYVGNTYEELIDMFKEIIDDLIEETSYI